jgi:hypothetical protein
LVVVSGVHGADSEVRGKSATASLTKSSVTNTVTAKATMAEEASSVSSIRAILKDPDRLHVAQRSGKKSCKSGGGSKPSSQTEAHRYRSSSTANRNTRAISPPKAEVYHTSRRFQQGRKISSFDPIMPTDRCFNRDWRAGLPAARISPTSGCSAQQTGRGCASWIAASRR